jgi:hypothetical protein
MADDDQVYELPPGFTPAVPPALNKPGAVVQGGYPLPAGFTPSETAGERAAGIGRELAQGASLAHGPEAISTARAYLEGGEPGPLLGEEKKALEKYTAAHPKEAAVERLAGGAIPWIALSRVPGGAQAMGLTGSNAAIPVGMGLSAAQGGAEAHGEGQDPVMGALMGAAGGIAAPIAGKVAGATMGRLYDWGRSGLSRLTGGRVGSAAASGPLAGFDPHGIGILAAQLKGDAPDIAKRAAELGPEGMLFEFSPSLKGVAQGVAAMPGPGKAPIETALRDRANKLPANIESALDQSIGPYTDIHAQTKQMEAARSAAAGPLYDAFHATKVFPTQPLKDVMPVINSEGLAADAKRIANIDSANTGKPVQFDENFFTTGNQKNFPTASSWDYIKRAIDGRIEKSYNELGKPTTDTYLLTKLRDKIVDAIDNHPDPAVAGVWQQARQAWGEPTRVMNAMREGQDWQKLDREEIPDLLARLQKTPGALEGFRQGMRKDVGDTVDQALKINPIEGGTARGIPAALNQFMSKANQDKLNLLLGGQHQPLVDVANRGDVFRTSFEDVLRNSQTAPRAEGVKAVTPDPQDLFISQLKHGHMAYSPHVTPQAFLIPRSMVRGAEEAQKQRFAAMRGEIAPALVSQGQQAQDFANALQNYSPPGRQLAAPSLNYVTNLLARSGWPSRLPANLSKNPTVPPTP